MGISKNGKVMGRPVKGSEAKDVSLHLRISKTDDKRIRACADLMGVPRAEVIMQAIELLEQRLAVK